MASLVNGKRLMGVLCQLDNWQSNLQVREKCKEQSLFFLESTFNYKGIAN
jgi:hypothetical protein